MKTSKAIIMEARARISYGHNYEIPESGWSLADHPVFATLPSNVEDLPEGFPQLTSQPQAEHFRFHESQLAKWRMEGLALPQATKRWIDSIWGDFRPKNVNATLATLMDDWSEANVPDMLTRNGLETAPGRWLQLDDEAYFMLAQAQRATIQPHAEGRAPRPWTPTPDDLAATTCFALQRLKEIDIWKREQELVRRAPRHHWKEETRKQLVDGKRLWIDAHAHELPPLTIPPITIQRGAIKKKMAYAEWLLQRDTLMDDNWFPVKQDEGLCHQDARYVLKLPDGTYADLGQDQGRFTPVDRINPETALQSLATRLGLRMGGGDTAILQALLQREDIIPAYTTYWQGGKWLVIAAWQRNPKLTPSRWTLNGEGNLIHSPGDDQALTVSQFEYAILSGATILKDVDNRPANEAEAAPLDWLQEELEGPSMDFDELVEREPESDDDREEVSMDELEPEESTVIWTLAQLTGEMMDISQFYASPHNWEAYYELLKQEGRRLALERKKENAFFRELMGEWLSNTRVKPCPDEERQQRWSQLQYRSKYVRGNPSKTNLHLRNNILLRCEGIQSPLDGWRLMMRAFFAMTENHRKYSTLIDNSSFHARDELLPIKHRHSDRPMARWDGRVPMGHLEPLNANPAPQLKKARRLPPCRSDRYVVVPRGTIACLVTRQGLIHKPIPLAPKPRTTAAELKSNPAILRALAKLIRKELEA